MPYARRIDSTQREIVDALEKLGCRVHLTFRLPNFPDLVVECAGLTATMEVKGPKTPIKYGQTKFAEGCKGLHFIVRSVPTAIEAVALMRDKAHRMQPTIIRPAPAPKAG